MSRPPFTAWEILQALTVDVIRRLWDDGQYRDNKWLVMIHANWFDIWVEWKTAATMAEVDYQVEELQRTWSQQDDDRFQHSETIEGETPLGGEMRLRAPYMDREEP